MSNQAKNSKPNNLRTDEVKKQFWQYRRVQLGVIGLLVAGSYILPKIPLLRGWESKFTAAAVEISKQSLPADATRIKTSEEALALYSSSNSHMADYLKLKGPIPLAAWPCMVVNQKALCVKYLWRDNDHLTVVVTRAAKKIKKKAGPFTKAGLAGYFFVSLEKDLAFAVVGPFDPEDILNILNLPPDIAAAAKDVE